MCFHEKVMATHIDSHFCEEWNKLRLEDDALRIGVHDAKLINGAQECFGCLHFFLLLTQLPQNKLQHLI